MSTIINKPDFTDLFFKYADLTDKETNHGYGHLYSHILKDMPPVNNILLLGCNLFGGGDLLAFADAYPTAQIIGVDEKNDKFCNAVKIHPRIQLHCADVYCSKTAELFQPDSFDIIIDDCLHEAIRQKRAFDLYHTMLRHHGIYVIEDVYALKELVFRLEHYNKVFDFLIYNNGTQGNNQLHGTENFSCLVVIKHHKHATFIFPPNHTATR